MEDYLPKGTATYVEGLLNSSFTVRISRPRKTKLGDFRPSLKEGIPHKISINSDLNPYNFLITLIHEIAHAITWDQYQRKALPHGKEWKQNFQQLMLPLIAENVLPNDIMRAVSSYMINPKASSCSDIGLLRVLKNYDKESENPTGLTIEKVPHGSEFIYGKNRVFIKQERLRKRYKCVEKSSGKTYLFQPFATVEIVDK